MKKGRSWKEYREEELEVLGAGLDEAISAAPTSTPIDCMVCSTESFQSDDPGCRECASDSHHLCAACASKPEMHLDRCETAKSLLVVCVECNEEVGIADEFTYRDQEWVGPRCVSEGALAARIQPPERMDLVDLVNSWARVN